MVTGALHQTKILWAGFNWLQQVVFIVLGLATFLTIFGLFYWANRPDFITLYAQLDPSDAAAIVEHLKEANVPYQLSANGTRILVPSSAVHETRLGLANRGLPSQGVVGFEIFDQSKVGVTDFVQKLNYQRALQGELSRTISRLRQVRQARVHLVMPKPSILSERDKPATAAVVVDLRPGSRLSRDEIHGIVHLVSASVEGLDPEKVTVLNEAGRILSRTSEGDTPVISGVQLEYERELERRVQSMLEEVVGPNRAVVRVAAQIDLTRGERVEERFDPTPVAWSGQGSAGGFGGSTEKTRGLPEAETMKETKSITYEVGKISERTILPGGEVKRLSVAVVLDGVYQTATEEKNTVRRKYVPRTAEELEKIKKLVMRAVGFNASRGDEVEVVELPFMSAGGGEEIGSVHQRASWPVWADLANRAAKPVAFVLGLLLIFLLLVRPLLKTLEAREGVPYRELHGQTMGSALEERLGAGLKKTATLAGLPTAGDLEEGRHEELRHQLVEMTRARPDQLVHVVRNWLAPRQG